jgi:hypothetical protein
MITAHISNKVILGYPTLWAYGLAQIPLWNALIRISDYSTIFGRIPRTVGVRKAVVSYLSLPTLSSAPSVGAMPQTYPPPTLQENTVGGRDGSSCLSPTEKQRLTTP